MGEEVKWQDTVRDLLRSFQHSRLDDDNLIHQMFANLLEKVSYAISIRDLVYGNDGNDASKGIDYKAMLACFIFTPDDMNEILTKFYKKGGF